MKKQDFYNLPKRKKWDEDIGEFLSLIILPQKKLHRSGFRLLDFVAVGKNNEPLCRLSGYSDLINLDGIGGFGYRWKENNEYAPQLIPPKGWSIDLLPCGLFRIFSDKKLLAGNAISSFELFSKEAKNE